MDITTKDPFDPRSDVAKKLNEYPFFTARPIRTIDNGPAWNSLEIAVFEHHAHSTEVQIGSYVRNYSLLDTFCWFRRGNKHFALYSPEYTATRIMEIVPGQGFKDVGGEEPESGGFCPAEFYVPDSREYISQEFAGPGTPITHWDDPLASLPSGCEFAKNSSIHRGSAKLRGPDGNYLQTESGWVWGEQQDYESAWIKLPPDHGFVAGCVWGDDSRWKVQYLDLSRIDEGIVKREERFGYIELPKTVALRNAIHVNGLLGTPWIDIAVSTEWDLRTGKMKTLGVPPWDEE